ncbi:hypothetical protein BH10PLA1_BH10PLA1_03660 [soil metagenome]
MNRLTIASAPTFLLLLVCSAIAQPTTQPDAETQIDTPLESVSFENLTLPEVIATLGEKAHVNLVADWPSLNYRHDINSQKLQGTYRYLTVKQLIAIAFITAATDPPQLVVDGNIVRVTGPAKAETKIFHLGPHLAKRLEAARNSPPPSGAGYDASIGTLSDDDALVKAITESVPKDSWLINGGTIGSLHVFMDRIIVTQTPDSLAKIEKLLQQLEADLAK